MIFAALFSPSKLRIGEIILLTHLGILEYYTRVLYSSINFSPEVESNNLFMPPSAVVNSIYVYDNSSKFGNVTFTTFIPAFLYASAASSTALLFAFDTPKNSSFVTYPIVYYFFS